MDIQEVDWNKRPAIAPSQNSGIWDVKFVLEIVVEPTEIFPQYLKLNERAREKISIQVLSTDVIVDNKWATRSLSPLQWTTIFLRRFMGCHAPVQARLACHAVVCSCLGGDGKPARLSRQLCSNESTTSVWLPHRAMRHARGHAFEQAKATTQKAKS